MKRYIIKKIGSKFDGNYLDNDDFFLATDIKDAQLFNRIPNEMNEDEVIEEVEVTIKVTQKIEYKDFNKIQD